MITLYKRRTQTLIYLSLLHKVRIVQTPGHVSLHDHEPAKWHLKSLGTAGAIRTVLPRRTPTDLLNYTETLKDCRQSHMYLPPPVKSLSPEDVACRPLQTNQSPCLYILVFHPIEYPSCYPYCGANTTVYQCTWECPQQPGNHSIPSP